MKKLRRKYKVLNKLLVCICSVVMIFACDVINVFADETVSVEEETTVDENLNAGTSFDGKVIPYLPDEVYGKNYVIIYQSLQNFTLYILPDDTNVYAKNASSDSGVYTGSGTVVMNFSFPENTVTSSYIYNITTGWSEPTVLSGTEFTLTPGNLFIERSTLDIYNLDDNSIVFFEANADIIYPNDISIFLGDFGKLLTGSIGIISTSTVGIVSVFIVVAGTVVSFFYALFRR